ncbi:MFS transporter [Cytophaga aurantiaca]|uniref:MFS transporter n=1 Tax=Cytophaga aurantiaca TaxID=29530 RepID=UPI00036D5B6E|nr:MFS transporter [Cytophaga aurantiaca]
MFPKKARKVFISSFASLHNKTFATLYFAETISLLGDAFTWVGLALLSYQFGIEKSAVILSIALTLRVSAFILFAPFAGVVADKIDRKKILYITHFIRMGIVCFFPFVDAEWQIYVLVFLLNIFNAFFTPTYKSIIPHIIDKENYRQAIGLSTATFQLLGVLGPGLAGIVSVWLGARYIFFLDAASFIIAGILILKLPADSLNKTKDVTVNEQTHSIWSDVFKGTQLLFSNKLIRFALIIEFISAIAGAEILVNTIGHIKNDFHLTDNYYGWVMAAFGVGAAIAAFVAGNIDKSKGRTKSLIIGVLVLGFSIIAANYVDYYILLFLWLIAGLGQSLAEMPSETLIGENIEEQQQGKVYGAHFAFSHLWWAIAYPIAGLLGNIFPHEDFLYAGILSLALLLIIVVIYSFKKWFTNSMS